jgi:hypothetical protein
VALWLAEPLDDLVIGELRMLGDAPAPRRSSQRLAGDTTLDTDDRCQPGGTDRLVALHAQPVHPGVEARQRTLRIDQSLTGVGQDDGRGVPVLLDDVPVGEQRGEFGFEGISLLRGVDDVGAQPTPHVCGGFEII